MGTMINFLVVLMFVSVSLVVISADIRSTEIVKEQRHTLIDVFEFSDKGGIELNVSDIDIAFSPSMPIRDVDLSIIGFFLSAKEGFIDHNRGIRNLCYFQESHHTYFKVLYGFDQLHFTSFDLVYNISHQGTYELLFQNCLWDEIQVSMKVKSSMHNFLHDGGVGFLSASKVSGMSTLIALVIAYLVLCVVVRGTEGYDNHKTPPFVLYAIILKVLSLCFEWAHRDHINNTGASEELWTYFLAIMSPLMEEIALLTVIRGIYQIDYLLKFNYMFKFVGIAQLALAIWKFGIAGQEPCSVGCAWDLFYYRTYSIVVLSPLLYNIRINYVHYLVLGGLADGKAANNLKVVEIVKSFFCGLYFYMNFIAVTVLVFEGPGSSRFFTYLPMVFLAREFATLALYIFMWYTLCYQVAQMFNLEKTEAEEHAARQFLEDRVARERIVFF